MCSAFRTASSTIEITRSLSGGSLGGMLEFRSQMLDPARNYTWAAERRRWLKS